MIKIIFLIASVLEAECSICDLQEKQLVVSTVLNRCESKDFPDSIEDVIFQKNQFVTKKPSQESIEITKQVISGIGRNYSVLYFYKPNKINKNIMESKKIIYKKKYHYYAK